ncbi:hypothetical protein BYT27DRAFT_7228990 [Phlegmacium glaucopus]|nr:hypothetical protein BYT27DRAFT_7228990 [Phlegmacium glaucopus]
MAAWTPIVKPISVYSTDLSSLVETSLQTLKSTTRVWQTNLQSSISTSPQHFSAITEWLSHSTAMDASILPPDVIIQAFLDTQLLCYTQQNISALQTLSTIQKKIDMLKFGTNDLQQHQHSLLEDLGEEELSEEIDRDEEEYPPTSITTPPNQILNSPPSEPHSPEYKRACFSKDQHTDIPNLPLTTFEAFDSLPILARNKSKWNRLLQSNPGFWAKKCLSWANALKIAFNHRMDTNENDQQIYYQSVVDVQATVYNQVDWKTAVKKSDLHTMIHSWSDPCGLILWKANFAQILMRKHRIHESLSLVLFTWIPSTFKLNWKLGDFFQQFTFKNINNKILGVKDLFKAFRKYPNIIPHKAYPSSIFFLLNFDNFELALEQWLIYGLEIMGYNVSFFKDTSNRKQIYDGVYPYIKQLPPSYFQGLNPILCIIIKRSSAFSDLKEKPAEHIFQNKNSFNSQCGRCSDLASEDHCIQKIQVKACCLPDEYVGCGVSLAEPQERMEPIPIPHSKHGSKKIQKIYHPQDLGLKKIMWNNDVLARCGMQISLIVDSDTQKILNFWIYNAFSKEVFEHLLSHYSQLQKIKVKAVKRGSQFNSYSQGQMFPKGACAPMGGAPGDAYTFYTGMEALEEEDIETLFDDAEDSMILSQAGRLILHSIFHELETTTVNTDRLGISGANIYYCNNYTSPLH